MPKKEAIRRRAPRRILSIDEVNEKFDGEWVMLSVTHFDERHVPTRGRILAHSPDPDEVYKAVPARDADSGPHYLYAFYAEPRIRSGPEYERAMKEFVEQLQARLDAVHRGMA